MKKKQKPIFPVHFFCPPLIAYREFDLGIFDYWVYDSQSCKKMDGGYRDTNINLNIYGTVRRFFSIRYKKYPQS